MASTLQSQAPKPSSFILSYPTPSILLITINRPQQMNSIPSAAHWEADAIIQWFDNEPSLRVAIITGAGSKAFCAGQDLIEQAIFRKNPPPASARRHPPTGFAGISKRVGKKPVIAAVNGFALGGGFEICLNWNSDLVVASPTASFGLPEATVGLYASAGGLPRVVRNCGMQVASEIALTGRRLTPEEALKHNLINKISKTQESVIDESIEMAKKITMLSPDAVIVTRAGLRETWETASVERGAQIISDRFDRHLFEGENMKIGVEAFAAKKKPQWVPSKL
ncbi:Carnitinyl-CoA dehydratase [Lachnellula hyalina]|uniref:Carnitinyl-CoA dehydratase n=1 Tax=Lachnellula hyalina TaxID=1316788 RepID=A0A8H8QYU9_9HELO|nr:Carnitinyl-CoA dehydratase [Lachnellula hyalina]TVY24561.1 Carnitinyl-CoA dehydratase [Lachnellula hyalina]